MTKEVSYADRLKSTRDGRNRLLTERAIVGVTTLLEEAMAERNVSRAELARLLGKSKGWVTQLLDGENNKTIRTISYVFAVLDAELELSYKPISGRNQPKLPAKTQRQTGMLKPPGRRRAI